MGSKTTKPEKSRNQNTLRRIIRWLDDNILLVLTSVLIVAIPAYPKLPLADLIEGYIVRLRAEDILVGLTMLVWVVQLIRKKITLPKNTIAKLIGLYLLIGLLSSLSAVFITRTVPMQQQHLFKLALHYFRRIEYMSLFFITYSSIKSMRDLKLFIKLGLTTLVVVTLYGFGQKYLYWPAYSTMNREFSKGTRLYLSPTSRVMSTFAGHYDYAAYLMIMLVFLIAAIWNIKRWRYKIGLLILTAIAYWSLILTASRTSFIGYIVGVTILAVIFGKSLGRLRALGNWFITVLVSTIIMLTMGDLSERFFQVLRSPDILVHEITRVTPIQRDVVGRTVAVVQDKLLAFENALGIVRTNMNKPFKKEPPPDSISTEEALQVAVKSDIPPTTTDPTAIPPDVTEEEEALRKKLEATISGTTKEGEYSPNALKYGLSVAIRLDALWPRAIAGFKRNPLLGSGYSTLVKEDVNDFTQAESTDNDYLRMLGETGLLGTLSFLTILAMLIMTSVKIMRSASDRFHKVLAAGMIAGIGALLVNATYIDVFESSKVIYTFWILSAIIVVVYEKVIPQKA